MLQVSAFEFLHALGGEHVAAGQLEAQNTSVPLLESLPNALACAFSTSGAGAGVFCHFWIVTNAHNHQGSGQCSAELSHAF